jgi:hypothetical protein
MVTVGATIDASSAAAELSAAEPFKEWSVEHAARRDASASIPAVAALVRRESFIETRRPGRVLYQAFRDRQVADTRFYNVPSWFKAMPPQWWHP